MSKGVKLRHLLLILCVSAAYEALFVHHGIGWLFDEGWPLYAAMKLQLGGTLYGDVFFLFPPGSLLPAWIAHTLDPPGVILARYIYAGFSVALSVSIYLLGRRLMPPGFALLGALLLAVAAPRSHLVHVLFGYRYLVFSVLALIAFGARLRSGRRSWMVAAGFWAGVAVVFRLTPAFAVSCGIAVAVMTADRDWRSWLRDWGLYALGVVLVLVPVGVWLANGAGLEAAWQQSVLRILPLQGMQSKPVPEMIFPTSWNRREIYRWFVPVQYWLYPLIYAGYLAVLARSACRSSKEGRGFSHSLLLAVVIWGAVFFLRALGRSDEHHLVTALPPAMLLLAHLASLAFRGRSSRVAPPVFCVAALALWVFLQGSDLYLDRERRGVHPLACLDGEVSVGSAQAATELDLKVKAIVAATTPDDKILDLTNAPLLHVLTQRDGPGYGDVVTPGVFADPDDEIAFVERLRQDPPALVLWPSRPFDGVSSRWIGVTAPLLFRWVRENYENPDPQRGDFILSRREAAVEVTD